MVTRNGGVSLRAYWVLLFAIAGLLAAGSVACPVWISAMNASSDPCSDEAPMQEECPPSICAVGSPYLASDIRRSDAPDFRASHAEVPHVAAALAWPTTVRQRHQDWIPPGSRDPVFLRIHVLLI
jgi:hypothetical protein